MQAIRTKVIPYTNTKPKRIRAACAAKALIVTYDTDKDDEDAHKRAAIKLRDALGWTGELIGGGYAGDYYWVFKPEEPSEAPAPTPAPRGALDATPTWSQVLPLLLATVADPKRSPEARKTAIDELTRAIRMLDLIQAQVHAQAVQA